jgi:rhodanese-related sulfurtransferase
VALLLKERGFTDVYPLRGGWTEWVARGFPTEPVAAGVLTGR